MSNLYQSFYCTMLICCLAVSVQAQSFNLNFNSEFTAIHEMENGHYLLAFNQFTNGEDNYGFSTGWIELDENLNSIDTTYSAEITDFQGDFYGSRIKQFIENDAGQILAIYEYFDCDYFPSDGVVYLTDDPYYIQTYNNLLDMTSFGTGYVGIPKGSNRITLLDNELQYEDHLTFNTKVSDILYLENDLIGVATEDQIHVINKEGVSTFLYETGAMHLSTINDTIFAISESQFYLFDFELNLLEAKTHNLVELPQDIFDPALRFKQIEDHIYLFKEYTQTEQLIEISEKGDSVRMVTLPNGTVINDLYEKNALLYSIGFDLSGLKYDIETHLIYPPDKRSTCSSIKAIDFDTPINTEIDISLNNIQAGNDSYAINASCNFPFGTNNNLANVYWKLIDVDISNTGNKPISSFAIKGEFRSSCNSNCGSFYTFDEWIDLSDNPIEAGEVYTYTIASVETPQRIKSPDDEYELCLWVSNANNEQDMNPDNNYYCGTFPVISSVQQIESSQVVIFPNPSSQYVSIQMNEEYSGTKEVYIYDLGGQLINQTSFAGNRIDLNIEHLVSGTYYLNIRSQKQSYSEKLIVIKD